MTEQNLSVHDGESPPMVPGRTTSATAIPPKPGPLLRSSSFKDVLVNSVDRGELYDHFTALVTDAGTGKLDLTRVPDVVFATYEASDQPTHEALEDSVRITPAS